MKITLNSTRPNNNCHFEPMSFLLTSLVFVTLTLLPDVRCFDIKIVSGKGRAAWSGVLVLFVPGSSAEVEDRQQAAVIVCPEAQVRPSGNFGAGRGHLRQRQELLVRRDQHPVR